MSPFHTIFSFALEDPFLSFGVKTVFGLVGVFQLHHYSLLNGSLRKRIGGRELQRSVEGFC